MTNEADEVPRPYALVSLYSRPIQELLVESSNTLWACRYHGDDNLRLIDISCIMACVSMQQLPQLTGDNYTGLWFVVEKSGLEDAQLTGFEERLDDNITTPLN